jgi:hypothetical protein
MKYIKMQNYENDQKDMVVPGERGVRESTSKRES